MDKMIANEKMSSKSISIASRQECLAFILALLMLATCSAAPEKRCSDGSPALIQCVPLPKRNPLRVEFICEAQPSFACDPLGDTFYCCAPIMRLPPTLALARDLRSTKFITSTATAPPRVITLTAPGTTTMIKTVSSVAAATSRSEEEETCTDHNSQCSYIQPLCNNNAYQRMLAAECPKTCRFCNADSAKCVDRGKDCQRASFLCNLKVSNALMTQECAKTCGKCPSRARVNDREKTSTKKKAKEQRAICKDNYTKCDTWKLSGFCITTTYSHKIKHRFCAKTCNFC